MAVSAHRLLHPLPNAATQPGPLADAALRCERCGDRIAAVRTPGRRAVRSAVCWRCSVPAFLRSGADKAAAAYAAQGTSVPRWIG